MEGCGKWRGSTVVMRHNAHGYIVDMEEEVALQLTTLSHSGVDHPKYPYQFKMGSFAAVPAKCCEVVKL